ncbi:peptidase E [Brevibacterium picturae]|uniref:Type 1 glutamine amidotransferase-like domain-containing protein n=1 Tax=Brevibacterium picturae TaxID=260553 RepID=A0ABP4LU16_9MICO
MRSEEPKQSTIVTLGGGGFSMSETGESAIDDYLLQLASSVRGTRSTESHHRRGGGEIPRVCFVPTASGDNPDYIRRFEAAFDGRAEKYVLSLFGQSPWDYQDPQMLLDMDLIYVGGGPTANLLALWRRHGVDDIMRRAASDGTVLAGVSAGANCWFEASSTDSFGSLAALDEGLGILPGSVCPHYHGEAGRAEMFRTWIGTGQLPGPGLAIDDHAAVVFENATATSVMVERPEANAYLVDGWSETRLGTDDAAATLPRHLPRRVLE